MTLYIPRSISHTIEPHLASHHILLFFNIIIPETGLRIITHHAFFSKSNVKRKIILLFYFNKQQ